MRAFICLATLLVATPFTAALAQAPASSATASPTSYTTSDTDIGTLLDDPAAKAIVDKHIPGFSAGEQVDMARGMTLKAIQQFAPDRITDQTLADIDGDFAKLAAKKK